LGLDLDEFAEGKGGGGDLDEGAGSDLERGHHPGRDVHAAFFRDEFKDTRKCCLLAGCELECPGTVEIQTGELLESGRR